MAAVLAFLGCLDSLALSPEAQTDERRIEVLRAKTLGQWPNSTKRFALVIGVDNYQDTQISSLNGASNDAKAFADAQVSGDIALLEDSHRR